MHAKKQTELSYTELHVSEAFIMDEPDYICAQAIYHVHAVQTVTPYLHRAYGVCALQISCS